MDHTQKAMDIIAGNIYMTIASASSEGKPWISPVFFAYDEHHRFFWVSNKDSIHSTLIKSNPRIAIVIFDSKAPEGKGDGVYMEASARELEEEAEIGLAIEILNRRVTKEEFRVKALKDVTGEGVWRIYQANPVKAYTLSDGEYVNGQYIDTRVEIILT